MCSQGVVASTHLVSTLIRPFPTQQITFIFLLALCHLHITIPRKAFTWAYMVKGSCFGNRSLESGIEPHNIHVCPESPQCVFAYVCLGVHHGRECVSAYICSVCVSVCVCVSLSIYVCPVSWKPSRCQIAALLQLKEEAFRSRVIQWERRVLMSFKWTVPLVIRPLYYYTLWLLYYTWVW